MQSLPPLAIPGMIVLAAGLMVALVAFINERRRFSGYRHIAEPVKELARQLKGEAFRDGHDLVVNGATSGLPVQVRFSNADNMPGLDIRLGAHASFNLYVAPRSAKASDGRYALRTPDEMLNARAETRSDNPTQAKLLLSANNVTPALGSLCRSGNVYLRMTRGVIEVIDLTPPTAAGVKKVASQLASMRAIADQLRQMPDADTVKVEAPKREPRYVLTAALSAGAAAVVVAMVIGYNMSSQPVDASEERIDIPNLVKKEDAVLIPSVQTWRIASAEHFNTNDVAWARAAGAQISGRMPGDYSGTGSTSDVAYVLVKASGEKRVVLLSKGTRVFDTRYAYVGVAARVPHEFISTIQWAGPAPQEPAGDGLLIVRAPNDPGSGLIIFTRGDHAVSGVPKDYQTIRLE